MTLKLKLLTFAALVGFAVSGLAGDEPWFGPYNFETSGKDATFNELTNAVPATGWGKWTWYDGDESEVEAVPPEGQKNWPNPALKLNTQGTSLMFEPYDGPLPGMTKTIIEADIYFVGSDSAPGIEDFDKGNDVQTAVFLKNYVDDEGTGETTNSVFCAYVHDGTSYTWVELDFGNNVNVVDTNWYKLKIEIDYSGVDPVPSYYINGFLGAGDIDCIANFGLFQDQVTSISFRGTGSIDNFVGSQFVPDENFFRYTAKGFWIDNQTKTDVTGDTIITASSVDFDGIMEIEGWSEYYDDEDPYDLVLVVIKSSIGLYELDIPLGIWTNGPNDMFTIDFDNGKFIFNADLDGILDDEWEIEFYYGDYPGGGSPLFEDPYKQSDNMIPFELVIGGDYAEVNWNSAWAPVEIENDYFVVRVISAGKFVTYSLIEIDDLEKSFDTDGFIDDPLIGIDTGVERGDPVILKSYMYFDADPPFEDWQPKDKAFFKVEATWIRP